MNINSLLKIASFTPNALNFSNAWVGHLPFAAWIMQEVSPSLFVELGTHTSNSYFSFCQAVSEFHLNTHCYAVDTWHSDIQAGEYDELIFDTVNQYNKIHYEAFSKLLRLTFDQALTCFDDGSIDLLHLDGLHTYEAVRHDFELWLPKLSPGAVILIHDTSVHDRDFGVHQLWHEIEERYQYSIHLAYSNGLGIMQLDNVDNDRILDFLRPNFTLKNDFCTYFQSLGQKQLDRYQQNNIINQLDRLLRERDIHVENLNEQISNLNSDNIQLRKHTENLAVKIADQIQHIENLNSQLIEKNQNFENQSKANHNLHLQLTSIISSKSWKLTKPLRFGRRIILQPSILKNHFFALYSLFTKQVQTYGFGGVIHRLPFYWRNRCHALYMLTNPNLRQPKKPSTTSLSVIPDFKLPTDLYQGNIPTINKNISIIIPTFNAGADFSWLLRKLFSQLGLGTIEIVIVDSGSTDGTAEIARDAGCTLIEITQTEFSHSYARNLGADTASGDYLLFMVQDAYPIGNYWLYGLLSFLLDNDSQRVAAVSSAEYSRSDSDIMYDSMIHTHYQFLECLEHDRIGELRGNDNVALRTNGQLSDVTCLISKEIFSHYRYQGDYAEDLDLGIRLIKDGYRTGFLSSIKVIHSHNRPAYYYLKRSFVDTIFLAKKFHDFPQPLIKKSLGIIAGIVTLAGHLSSWKITFDQIPLSSKRSTTLAQNIFLLRKGCRSLARSPLPCCLDNGNLDLFVNSLTNRFLPDGVDIDMDYNKLESINILNSFIYRLECINNYTKNIYPEEGTFPTNQLCDIITKSFSAITGTSLSFMYIQSSMFTGNDKLIAETIYQELKEGV